MGGVFLTGASGYVGRHLIPALGASEPVTALTRAPDRLPPPLRTMAGVRWVRGDLDEPDAWTSALAGCDRVVHLGAVTGKAPPEQYTRTVVEGTAALLDAARAHGVTRFLHVSTIAVAFRDRPRYFYAEAKEESERRVTASGLAHTIVRPTMVFGRGAAVLAGLTKLAGGPVVPMFGRGEVQVQPVDVADLAGDLAELVSTDRFDGETIEVGGPERLPIAALLQRIRVSMGLGRGRLVHLPLAPIRGTLALLEPLLLPLLPLTCGQLATFANDGTARPHPFTDDRPRRGLDETLALALGGEA